MLFIINFDGNNKVTLKDLVSNKSPYILLKPLNRGSFYATYTLTVTHFFLTSLA